MFYEHNMAVNGCHEFAVNFAIFKKCAAIFPVCHCDFFSIALIIIINNMPLVESCWRGEVVISTCAQHHHLPMLAGFKSIVETV